MAQFLFLQGAVPEYSAELQVTTLQEGKRFSSRHVRAGQGTGRTVLDAHVTSALSLEAPEHGSPSMAPDGERPEALPGLEDLSPGLKRAIHHPDSKPSIELRIPDAEQQLSAQVTDRKLALLDAGGSCSSRRAVHSRRSVRLSVGLAAELQQFWPASVRAAAARFLHH
jgi:acyl-CoA thioesterase